ncbi:MAG TPA: Co2+/Mg2+ efflux protein ApaG [Chitinophagales bacterium]|nr:Co2+/Mg2+ efflux protein ApaG [Chitinophagales bacterium]HNL08700.1 Co2+/Mg2+ efflux protein ApaG [Chitinophagales bacterium]
MSPTAITKGIKVSVESLYQPQHSQPQLNTFVFAYKITIENYNACNLQLTYRYWTIKDAYGMERKIEGEGVVGKQPLIAPMGMYQYISACQLSTEIGKMWGHYTIKNPETQETFSAEIPLFSLIAPFKMN